MIFSSVSIIALRICDVSICCCWLLEAIICAFAIDSCDLMVRLFKFIAIKIFV